jgi:hypothetical protein
VSLVIAVIVLHEPGRVPLRRLLFKRNMFMATRVDHADGRVPVNAFWFNVSIEKFVIEDQALGSVPLSLLSNRSSLERDDMVDQEEGSVPLSLLMNRSSLARDDMDDQEEGIVPMMVDVVRIRRLSFVRLVIASGRDPERQAAVLPEMVMAVTSLPLHPMLVQEALQGSPDPIQVAIGFEVQPAMLVL